MEEDIDPGLLSTGPPPQETPRGSPPRKPQNDLDDSDSEGADAAVAAESEPESESESDDDYTNETLSSTITREIQQGTYVCLVCTSEIDHTSKVWSCRSCYRVYDLDCIKDWAIRGSSTDKSSKNWRCPSCNIATNKIPSRFTCWCGQVTNPTNNPLVPFSCGNSCTYKYESCIHSCSSICHPGSHPICGAMGPTMKCHCGNMQKQLPCLITPYETGWACPDPCEVTLCDFGHKCPRGCHLGFCGLCDIDINILCYCGKEHLDIKCSEKDLKECQDKDGVQWVGGVACSNKTRVFYDCEVHFEDYSCQPLSFESAVCKMAPSQVTTCYCGKTTIQDKDRTKCTDPIPECESMCEKPLPCGCVCLMKCHEGECECHNYFDVKCSCGNETFMVPCKFIQDGHKPRCTHKCQALLNCRKHYHREQCCAYERVAQERERHKKKAIRNNVRTNFEDDIMSLEPAHICTRPCNRLKACGAHYCEALCHNGPCGVCLESSNEDLVCHCGKTRIEAPVRCGTKLVCHEQCVRDKACGHRREIHECHEDSVNCPKCTVLVEKECNCGLKSDVPGVLCSQDNVSCGNICTVAKSCGHPCLRVCASKCTKDNIHDSSTICRAQCNKIRKSCPHTCKLKCHQNKSGRSKDCDVTRCTEMVTVTCECGRIDKKVPCGSTRDEPSNIGNILECDESCAQAQRDRALKEAFSFSAEDSKKVSDQDFIYPDSIFETYEKQTNWCSRVENLMRAFIEDYNLQLDNGIKSPRRTFHFQAMSKPQRAFIHGLAETMNLYSESQDPEPKRSIFIVITRLTKLPIYSITEALRLRREALFEASRSALTSEEVSNTSFNALVIQDVFFGITKEDLGNALARVVEDFSLASYVLSWIKDSTFVFYSKELLKAGTEEYVQELTKLVSIVRSLMREKSLAFDCKLCLIDEEATIILKTEGRKPPANENSSAGSEKQSNNIYDVLGEEEITEISMDGTTEPALDLENAKKQEDSQEPENPKEPEITKEHDSTSDQSLQESTTLESDDSTHVDEAGSEDVSS
ncbi:uncharacterized protein CANTADRAFT_88109 [Suhomyces tanzawaensis NRRL Y-17324]|uniref:R3H domain-containing protein n=1 Tax=Suhomyces tanzawaensis NRRL Y-17324 TaxID=984487 RepID=A0A1E4SRQ0_9ASCO|nr:uncharacterized protein CANTADRAFT_88109 [Suhomyces tanzawaensis NRRL Y-17324]ODV82189.1 hypothetical protein CANTADRAFT_88109 [Suhomyces tanzawaensis NRRL Y-17324]